MERGSWTRVRGIVERALEVDARERDAFIERECAGDRELADEVRALLDHDPLTGKFEPPPSQVVATTLRASHAGRRLGPWRLEREIGAGGMGTVWLAQRVDGAFEQRAAIKLIKRGMDTDALLARFERERRVLATLEHPHIARLYDGGSTEDGLPYLVMEFVEGLPLDQYCDEHALPMRARLELFLDVCAAVEHAHRNLVVHRDLKPSNVLVGEGGVVKLLDFGIATVLSPEGDTTAQTVAHERVLTPQYASPEQLAGKPLTTQSDVFSLGVVLYELVAGRSPFDQNRRIDSEAPPPSAVARATKPRGARELDRDLDTIVLTAIQVDPARRYASVEALAEDVHRYLGDLPVRARPDTLVYRATKFVRRNKLAVGGAVALFASLAAGLIATASQYRAAVHARELESDSRSLAERRFADVRELATRFVFGVDTELARIAGATAARQMLVDTASEYLDRLSSERAEDRQLAIDNVVAYTRVAEILYQPGAGSLGKPTDSLAMLDKALAIVRELHASDPSDPKATLRYAHVLRPRAGALVALGRHAEAQSDLEQASQLAALVPDDASVAASARALEAELPMLLAELRLSLGDREGAQRAAEDAVALSQKLVDAHPDDAILLALLSRAHSGLAQALEADGDVDGALEHLEPAVALFARCRELDPERLNYRRDLAVANFRLHLALFGAGRFADALAPMQEALRLFDEIAQLDPRDGIAIGDLASAHSSMQAALTELGRDDEAFEHAARALELAERRVQIDEHDLAARSVFAIACFRFGVRLLERDDEAGGIERLRRAREQFELVAEASPDNADAQSNCAIAECDIGMTLAERAGVELGMWEEARADLAAGVARFRGLDARGALGPDGRDSLETYEQALRDCEERLSELRGASSDARR